MSESMFFDNWTWAKVDFWPHLCMVSIEDSLDVWIHVFMSHGLRWYPWACGGG